LKYVAQNTVAIQKLDVKIDLTSSAIFFPK
jgi:hypothetical protein